MEVDENTTVRKQVAIYTDGGCEPNPGAGGYGVVLIYGAFRKEISGGFRLTTNNRMEIYAAIKGLELLKEPCDVTLFSDSKYLVDAIEKKWVLRWKNRGWRLKSKERALNIDLWEQLLPLLDKHNVAFSWVKGHAGDANNERCDRLSMGALRKQNLPVDEGYENKCPEPQPVPMTEEGQPCRKCGTPVVKRFNRHHKPFLFCKKCNASYELKINENDEDVLKLF